MRRFGVCLGRIIVDAWREVGFNVRQEGRGSGVIQASNQEQVAV